MKNNLKILFVDDDIALLQSIRRYVRLKHKEWNCKFSNSGEEALKILSQMQFDFIISDMRMPQMDGSQLLRKVKEKYPATIRFILSGQTEQKSFIRAVGSMHQFLTKPCDMDTLKNTIARSISMRDLINNDQLKNCLLNVDSLPGIPEIYFELVDALQSDESTVEIIGEIISQDVGLTAKILQVANSSFFGSPQKVSTPAQAVHILGFEFIQVLALGYKTLLKPVSAKKDREIIESIWKHSLNVSQLALKLAKRENLSSVDENFCFTAGLLHDIGKIIALENFPEKYHDYLSELKEDNNTLQIEKKIFGSSLSEVGAYLLTLWGLPDPIVEAVGYHKNPSKCISKSTSPLTFVHIANALDEENISDSRFESFKNLDLEYLKEAGITESLFNEYEDLKESISKIE
ncbi:MAG: HDOD domain-containing protein [Nitrospinae bacterium]|nr:HDOD domain-containing protein [Nitrospinota bacterium]